MLPQRGPKNLVYAYDVATTPYSTTSAPQAKAEAHSDGLSDLVYHVQKHHQAQGRSPPSEQEIYDMIDKKSQEMGMTPEEGRGFWGDVWSGVKSVAKQLGQKAWDQVTSDPVGTFNAIKDIFDKVPVI